MTVKNAKLFNIGKDGEAQRPEWNYISESTQTHWNWHGERVPRTSGKGREAHAIRDEAGRERRVR